MIGGVDDWNIYNFLLFTIFFLNQFYHGIMMIQDVWIILVYYSQVVRKEYFWIAVFLTCSYHFCTLL